MNEETRVVVTGVSTAAGGITVGADQTREFIRRWFAEHPGFQIPGEPLLKERDAPAEVLRQLGVGNRRVCAPLYERGLRAADRPPVRERYVKFRTDASRLAGEAGRGALAGAGLKTGDLDAVVLVSTSGPLLYHAAVMLHGTGDIPSIEDGLREALDLPQSFPVEIHPGAGSAGGVLGIREGATLARRIAGEKRDGSAVLVLTVELLSWMYGAPVAEAERDPAREFSLMVYGALVGDGAGAMVLEGGERRGASHTQHATDSSSKSGSICLDYMGGSSITWPGTEDYLRYEPGPSGFTVRIRLDTPDVVRRLAGHDLDRAASLEGLNAEELGLHLVHPHSQHTLAAYSEAWDVPEEALRASADILKQMGNMSAPTIVFVLQNVLKCRAEHSAPTLGILAALGPGLTSEHAFLRFN